MPSRPSGLFISELLGEPEPPRAGWWPALLSDPGYRRQVCGEFAAQSCCFLPGALEPERAQSVAADLVGRVGPMADRFAAWLASAESVSGHLELMGRGPALDGEVVVGPPRQPGGLVAAYFFAASAAGAAAEFQRLPAPVAVPAHFNSLWLVDASAAEVRWGAGPMLTLRLETAPRTTR